MTISPSGDEVNPHRLSNGQAELALQAAMPHRAWPRDPVCPTTPQPGRPDRAPVQPYRAAIGARQRRLGLACYGVELPLPASARGRSPNRRRMSRTRSTLWAPPRTPMTVLSRANRMAVTRLRHAVHVRSAQDGGRRSRFIRARSCSYSWWGADELAFESRQGSPISGELKSRRLLLAPPPGRATGTRNGLHERSSIAQLWHRGSSRGPPPCPADPASRFSASASSGTAMAISRPTPFSSIVSNGLRGGSRSRYLTMSARSSSSRDVAERHLGQALVPNEKNSASVAISPAVSAARGISIMGAELLGHLGTPFSFCTCAATGFRS